MITQSQIADLADAIHVQSYKNTQGFVPALRGGHGRADVNLPATRSLPQLRCRGAAAPPLPHPALRSIGLLAYN